MVVHIVGSTVAGSTAAGFLAFCIRDKARFVRLLILITVLALIFAGGATAVWLAHGGWHAALSAR
jgi:hypothetical protein